MQPARRVLITMCLAAIGTVAPVAFAQDRAPAGVVFENVRIVDGTSDQLSGPSNVLVMGNVITSISSTSIADPASWSS